MTEAQKARTRKYTESTILKSVEFLLSKLTPSARVRVMNYLQSKAQEQAWDEMAAGEERAAA